MAPNSLTSLSSYDLVPCISLQTRTLRVAKHLHVDTQKTTDRPPTQLENVSRTVPPSMQNFLVRVKPQSRPSCHFLNAPTSKEGNYCETRRCTQTPSAKLMTCYSIIHHSSAINEKTKEKVAIKKLHRPFQSEIFAKRAYRELRLLKHMKHENVSRFNPTRLLLPLTDSSFNVCFWPLYSSPLLFHSN